WTEEPGIFGRIVFQIGILDEREIAGSFFDGGTNGGALSTILWMAMEADLQKSLRKALENFRSTVGGAIVDDHQFPIHVLRQGGGHDLGDAALDNRAFVVDRYEDRELHGLK